MLTHTGIPDNLIQRTRWIRLWRRLGGERWLFPLARLLYRLRIEGEAYIPDHGACLFAMNHVSQPADLLLLALLRRYRPDLALFAWHGLREENPLEHFLAGIGLEELGRRTLPAFKGRGLSAGPLLEAFQLLRRGGALAIAAEGEITWDGRLQYPLAPGTAWLALRSGAPVVPIVSCGGYDIQPRWRMDKMRLTGQLRLRVGPPFTFPGAPLPRVTDEALQAANQQLWEVLAGLLGV